MTHFFILILIGLVCIVVAMVIFLLSGKMIYDRMNAVFVMNTNVIMLIMTMGFIDGRYDMYIDIALSYSILGFVSTVILAKYIGGRRK
ncbi:MAG TPA: pH regulation protein F [Mogibacterium sp.]|nr:pH regulation protein F [Mogibacterium sp.]